MTVLPELIEKDRSSKKESSSKNETKKSSEDDNSSKLDYGDATVYFDRYAKQYFIYGWKAHWFLDCRYRKQLDDGSWHLQVGVTIKNEYGTEYDAVAEGIVLPSGVVTGFNVY